jgi:uncharacterized membrane protein YsdA (DUF1294 family)
MNLNRFCYLLLVCAATASLLTPHPYVTWFLLVSVLTLVIYGMDKMAARKAWRRVPESTLLVFGFVGGWPGAMVGQQVFRHKTQKQPFKTYFIISVILSILATLAVYQFSSHSSSTVSRSVFPSANVSPSDIARNVRQ